MQISRLDHVNLRTRKLDEMRNWYQDVLGMPAGHRPDFPFAGAWIYAGDVAFVHLIEIEEDDAIGSETSLKLEHFAFRATGAAEFEQRLQARGEEFKKIEIGNSGVVAFNIWDPDGNHIHVDFEPE